MSEEKPSVHIAVKDWIIIGLMGIGHAIVVFSALLHWTSRVVVVEQKVAQITRTIETTLPEMQQDVKLILQRMPRDTRSR